MVRPLSDARPFRKLLIEAYINVAGEKERIPKTGEVALRAGVSQRSVFERFGSLDALSLAAFDHILEPSMSTGDRGKLTGRPASTSRSACARAAARPGCRYGGLL